MSDLEPIAILADVLLPGNADASWPPASEVISLASWITASPDPAILRQLAGRVAACPTARRVELVAAFEATEPSVFSSLYGTLTDLYYTSPEAAANVAEMAAAGPQDPGPFDPARLAGVIARRAGRRRL